MRPIIREMACKFSRVYAEGKKGFSGQEITAYFAQFNNMVKPYEFYGLTPKRSELFIEALYTLLPKEQYYALTDLCINPPAMKYSCPLIEEREELMKELHSCYNPTPIALGYSRLREHVFREDWYISYNRIEENPASAITGARTLLETIFSTIIAERGISTDSSGDIARLLKETERALDFNPATIQPQHQILSGLLSVISGVASLSNNNGDRHGLVNGQEITSRETASLVVNACGTVGLFFIESHLFLPIKL